MSGFVLLIDDHEESTYVGKVNEWKLLGLVPLRGKWQTPWAWKLLKANQVAVILFPWLSHQQNVQSSIAIWQVVFHLWFEDYRACMPWLAELSIPENPLKSKPRDGAITNYSILAKPATENTRSKPNERISGKKNPENPDCAAFGCQALFWPPDGRISSGLVLSATPVLWQ